MKGSTKFWLGVFISGYIWFTYQAIWVCDYEKPLGAPHFFITGALLCIDFIWLSNCDYDFVTKQEHVKGGDYYFGIWWLLWQPIKYFNKALDKLLK